MNVVFYSDIYFGKCPIIYYRHYLAIISMKDKTSSNHMCNISWVTDKLRQTWLSKYIWTKVVHIILPTWNTCVLKEMYNKYFSLPKWLYISIIYLSSSIVGVHIQHIIGHNNYHYDSVMFSFVLGRNGGLDRTCLSFIWIIHSREYLESR